GQRFVSVVHLPYPAWCACSSVMSRHAYEGKPAAEPIPTSERKTEQSRSSPTKANGRPHLRFQDIATNALNGWVFPVGYSLRRIRKPAVPVGFRWRLRPW